MKILKAVLITLLIFILFSSLWYLIEVPYSNKDEFVGVLSIKKIHPLTDTVRFATLIFFTLLTYISVRFFQEKTITPIKNYFIINNFSNLEPIKIAEFKFIIYFLLVYLLIDFFSHNPVFFFYDPLHDGDNLIPTQNFDMEGGLWTASYAIHGASNSFYGYLGWKFFGIKSIGSLRYFYLIILFITKIFTIVLSFQISKIITQNNYNRKVIFFILSIILINFVDYQIPLNYSIISYRDLYMLIYIIFLIQLFSKNYINKYIIIFLSLFANFSLIMHYDVGTYLNLSNLILIIYLFFVDKKSYCFLIILSNILFWTFFIIFFGLDEFNSLKDHYLIILNSIDWVHGLPFPQPIFSVGLEEHGSRATKSIFLLIISMIILIESILFDKKKEKKVNLKIILIFIGFFSILCFKNALGRSDSYHIRMSTDFPLIILCTYSIYLILKFKKIKLIKKYLNKILIFSSMFLFLFMKLNAENMLNYNKNFSQSIYAKNEIYLNQDTIMFLRDVKEMFNNEMCVFNFTMDLGLPYLLDKKSCSKYFQTYVFSGIKNEKKYIQDLKNIHHSLLIYKSPNFTVDNIEIQDRLKYVNKYLQANYQFIYEKYGFIILKKN